TTAPSAVEARALPGAPASPVTAGSALPLPVSPAVGGSVLTTPAPGPGPAAVSPPGQRDVPQAALGPAGSAAPPANLPGVGRTAGQGQATPVLAPATGGARADRDPGLGESARFIPGGEAAPVPVGSGTRALPGAAVV